MSKKALPLRIDAGLLARVDERRAVLGQTRTLFVERALEAALGDSSSVERPAVVREVAGSIPAAPAPSHAFVDVSPLDEGPLAHLHQAPVESERVGRCPKATCQQSGLVGEACPLHPNLRFKVL
jgi:hypothetical protein